MTHDHNPLWYDHAEPDEPLNILTIMLIGTFAVAEFAYLSVTSLCQLVKGGIAVAFRDVSP